MKSYLSSDVIIPFSGLILGCISCLSLFCAKNGNKSGKNLAFWKWYRKWYASLKILAVVFASGGFGTVIHYLKTPPPGSMPGDLILDCLAIFGVLIAAVSWREASEQN